jgi:hypothetical protein
MSRRRLWANTHWEVAEDGVASLEPMEYFIWKNHLCQLRWGNEASGIANFPFHIADKIERPIEPFLEAFVKAIELLKPTGYEKVNVEATLALVREVVSKQERRKEIESGRAASESVWVWTTVDEK